MGSHPPPRAGDLLRGPPPAIPPPGIPGIPVRLPPPTSIGAPPPHILAAPPPRVGVLPPGAHMNPAFLAGAPGYPPPSTGLSEVEFEEIMARNRTVSSSAIARAVQDAAAGEFASAIETLVTAISLIKQSKVAGDDRCKILISSLQDTLHGIENKSYGARHGSHGGSRYSPDRRHRDRDREYYRERSRSRDREEYRKYYEDRDRYRDRERERDRRETERERDTRSSETRVKEEPRREEARDKERR